MRDVFKQKNVVFLFLLVILPWVRGSKSESSVVGTRDQGIIRDDLYLCDRNINRERYLN